MDVLQPREQYSYVVGLVGCLSWYSLLVIKPWRQILLFFICFWSIWRKLFVTPIMFRCLISIYLLCVVSFVLWFVSCGLLIVSWALSFGLLGMLLPQKYFQKSFIYLPRMLCAFLIDFLYSQPLYCMQASGHPTWKHVWTHSARNFVKFGATIVSCNLPGISMMWVNAAAALILLVLVLLLVCSPILAVNAILFYFAAANVFTEINVKLKMMN